MHLSRTRCRLASARIARASPSLGVAVAKRRWRRAVSSFSSNRRLVMDTLNKKDRSERMSRVKSKNSRAELLVRSIVHRLGFRFRVHAARLPGKPDVVLARHRKVIFVHGCFWHRHRRCRPIKIPENNTVFWARKFSENVVRDKRNQRQLRRLGWQVLVVWECETKDTAALTSKLKRFLERRA